MAGSTRFRVKFIIRVSRAPTPRPEVIRGVIPHRPGLSRVAGFAPRLRPPAPRHLVWRGPFPDPFGLCQEGLDFIRRSTAKS